MCDENKLIFDIIRNKFIYPLIVDVMLNIFIKYK